MKIANDLRWMNSGPLAGLARSSCRPAAGLSIMPGKVNPVIPRAVAMVCAQVMGNDTAIAIAGQSGNFQLNVMLPLVAHNLLQSLQLLANAMRLLAERAIAGFRVAARARCRRARAQPHPGDRAQSRHRLRKGAAAANGPYREARPIVEVAQRGQRPVEGNCVVCSTRCG